MVALSFFHALASRVLSRSNHDDASIRWSVLNTTQIPEVIHPPATADSGESSDDPHGCCSNAADDWFGSQARVLPNAYLEWRDNNDFW